MIRTSAHPLMCECCEQRPAIRAVRLADDVCPFAVCQLCAPVVERADAAHVQPQLDADREESIAAFAATLRDDPVRL